MVWLPDLLFDCVSIPNIMDPVTVAAPCAATLGSWIDHAVVVGGEKRDRILHLARQRHRRGLALRRGACVVCADLHGGHATRSAILRKNTDPQDAVGAERGDGVFRRYRCSSSWQEQSRSSGRR